MRGRGEGGRVGGGEYWGYLKPAKEEREVKVELMEVKVKGEWIRTC